MACSVNDHLLGNGQAERPQAATNDVARVGVEGRHNRQSRPRGNDSVRAQLHHHLTGELLRLGPDGSVDAVDGGSQRGDPSRAIELEHDSKKLGALLSVETSSIGPRDGSTAVKESGTDVAWLHALCSDVDEPTSQPHCLSG